MRGQAEVIIRSQIDDFLAVEGADRRLLVFEDAKAEVRALGLEITELVGEIGQRVGTGGGCCHRVLSNLPAAETCSFGRRLQSNTGWTLENQFAGYGSRFSVLTVDHSRQSRQIGDL